MLRFYKTKIKWYCVIKLANVAVPYSHSHILHCIVFCQVKKCTIALWLHSVTVTANQSRMIDVE